MCQKTCRILPKWRNFAKSGHTARKFIQTCFSVVHALRVLKKHNIVQLFISTKRGEWPVVAVAAGECGTSGRPARKTVKQKSAEFNSFWMCHLSVVGTKNIFPKTLQLPWKLTQNLVNSSWWRIRRPFWRLLLRNFCLKLFDWSVRRELLSSPPWKSCPIHSASALRKKNLFLTLLYKGKKKTLVQNNLRCLK